MDYASCKRIDKYIRNNKLKEKWPLIVCGTKDSRVLFLNKLFQLLGILSLTPSQSVEFILQLSKNHFAIAIYHWIFIFHYNYDLKYRKSPSKQMQVLYGHTDRVFSLCRISGNQLGSVDFKKNLKIWGLNHLTEEFECQKSFKLPESPAYMYLHSSASFLVGLQANKLQIYNPISLTKEKAISIKYQDEAEGGFGKFMEITKSKCKQLVGKRLSHNNSKEGESKNIVIEEGMMISAHYWTSCCLRIWDLSGKVYKCLLNNELLPKFNCSAISYIDVDEAPLIILGTWDSKILVIDLLSEVIENEYCMDCNIIRGIHNLCNDLLLLQPDDQQLIIFDFKNGRRTKSSFKLNHVSSELSLNC